MTEPKLKWSLKSIQEIKYNIENQPTNLLHEYKISGDNKVIQIYKYSNNKINLIIHFNGYDVHNQNPIFSASNCDIETVLTALVDGGYIPYE